MFKDSTYGLWHANAGARRLLNRGLNAPASGHPDAQPPRGRHRLPDRVRLHRPHDARGCRREANKYAERVGRVMNWGDGLYGGMFFSGMYAAAFFESDPRKVVEAGPAVDPGRQRLRADHPRRARVVRAVPGRLDDAPGGSSATAGTRTTSCPDGALNAVQHRRQAERRLRGPGPALRQGRLRADPRGLDPRRPGLRLQPLERGRHPRGDARLREDPRRSGRQAFPRSPTAKFAFTTLLVQRHRDEHARRGPSGCGVAQAGSATDEIVVPRSTRGRPASSSGTRTLPSPGARGGLRLDVRGRWGPSRSSRHADTAGAAAS